MNCPHLFGRAGEGRGGRLGTGPHLFKIRLLPTHTTRPSLSRAQVWRSYCPPLRCSLAFTFGVVEEGFPRLTESGVGTSRVRAGVSGLDLRQLGGVEGVEPAVERTRGSRRACRSAALRAQRAWPAASVPRGLRGEIRRPKLPDPSSSPAASPAAS